MTVEPAPTETREREQTRRARREPRGRRAASSWPNRAPLALLFSIPALLILLVMVVYPLVYTVYAAAHDLDPTRPTDPNFVGFGNFTTAFGDAGFLSSLRTTVVFVVTAVGLEFLIGTGLAVLVTYFIKRGRTLIRTALIIPMIMTPTAVGLVWRWMYDPQFGLLNYFVQLLGMNPQNWLGSPSTALGAVIAVEVWQWTPFVFLCMLAGLTSISESQYEAASVDGASAWRTLIHVMLPQMKGFIAVVLLFRTIDSLRVFDIIMVMTEGGPGNRTMILPVYIYQHGFRFFNSGYAATLSLLLVAAVSVLAILLLRALTRTGDIR